ncbi:MAG: glycosyltransferase [Cyanobacterium sp. T60_A2020_053]|nr:glycosyltransferase [Cyanobacterium sp. T60_A2020_053]
MKYLHQITYAIPTLNSALTLDTTLHSLKNQVNVDVNIIVVDSSSTDSTLEICQKWGVKTIYAEKGNIYRAINCGLANATTEWVAYINSDDWLYCDSLAKLIALGNKENADVVYGRCDYTDEYGRFVYSYEPCKPQYIESAFLSSTLGFSQQTTIFRKTLFDSLNGFDESYFLSGDRDFFVRALQKGAKFSFLDDFPVACFRLHQNQLSSSRMDEHRQEGKKIAELMSKKINAVNKIDLIKWRFSNLGHYGLRFLRQSLLCGRPTYTQNINLDKLHSKSNDIL